MPFESHPAGTPGELYRAFYDYFEPIPADTSELLDEVFALRYQVYCIEHHFEDPAAHLDGRERDEYDARAVHTLIRHKRTGYCTAAVRLILPDRRNPEAPFPLEHACMGSLYEEASSRIANLDRLKLAEVSRFAVSKEFRRRLGEAETVSGVSPHTAYIDPRGADTLRRGYPHITLGLIAAAFRMSVEQSITHWFAVMEPGLLRLLQRFGMHFLPVGPIVNHHGLRRPTLAAVAALSDGILGKRPDVWELVTDRGRFVPIAAQPDY